MVRVPSPFAPTLHQNRPKAAMGTREEQIQDGSGLRVHAVSHTIVNDPNYFTGLGANPLPFAGTLTAGTDWVTLTNNVTGDKVPFLEHEYLPVPMTPFFTIHQAHGAQVVWDKQIKLRVTGYDQFYNAIVETTDWLTLFEIAGATTTAKHHLWLSMVFSRVTKIEYIFRDVGAANVSNQITAGYVFCPVLPEVALLPAGEQVLGTGAADDLGTFYNQGIGTVVRVNPYVLSETELASGGIDGGDGAGRNDIVGLQLTNLSNSQVAAVRPLPELDLAVDGSIRPGGFLLGNSDSNLVWDGFSHKLLVVGANDPAGAANTPSLFLRKVPTEFPDIGITVAWLHNFRLDVVYRTSLGAGKAKADYPKIIEYGPGYDPTP